MTTQIAVRLPDDMVASLDELVASGAAPSRAAVVARALRAELRRAANARDIAILLRTQDAEGEAIAAWHADQPTTLDLD